MNKLRYYMRDNNLMKTSFFIIFTFTMLLIVYFTLDNFSFWFSKISGGIQAILSALSPLWIGIVLAYMLDPLVVFFDKAVYQKVIKKDLKPKTFRFMAIATTFMLVTLCLVGILYGFVSLVTGKLVVESIPKLFDNISNIIMSYETDIKNWAENMTRGAFSEKITEFANSVISWITDNLDANRLIGNVTSVVGSIFNFLVAIVASIYLLADKESLKEIWNKYSPLFIREKRLLALNDTAKDINHVLSLFVRGVLLDSLIISIISSVGFFIIGLKFTVFLGIFAGISNIIPYFGPIIGMVPAFIVGVFTDDIKQGLFALLVLIIVQQLDGNLIYPKVVGGSTGLNPLVVLLAVSFFGHFYGIGGMIIAVPATAILQILFLKQLKKVENKKKSKASAPGSLFL